MTGHFQIEVKILKVAFLADFDGLVIGDRVGCVSVCGRAHSGLSPYEPLRALSRSCTIKLSPGTSLCPISTLPKPLSINNWEPVGGSELSTGL